MTRAPAYDVTVFSDMDPSDMVYIDPLETDGLDNDGDGEIDEAGGEGSIIPDNIINDRTVRPAQIITAFDHSDALLRIDAGDSVTFYYRVDPDNRVAPNQRLVETAYATYDSLENESGNQSDPRGVERRDRRRASVYVSNGTRPRSRSFRSRCSRRLSCGSRIRR